MKKHVRAIFRRLHQSLRKQAASYHPDAYSPIILSYSQKHYLPNMTSSAEYAFMSAHVIAKHLYESLSTLGPVYYADEPGIKRTRLFVTPDNWSRGKLVKRRNTILFLPTSHLEQRRERYLRYAAIYGIAPEAIMACPSLEEIGSYRQGLERADCLIILGNETVKQTYLCYGVPQAKLVVLNSGIDFDHFLPQKRTHNMLRFVFPVTYPTLGKGFPCLMDVWQRIQSERRNQAVLLDILGDRGRRDVVIEQYAHLPNVRWNGGYIGGSQEHLDKLAQAHYVVFPSLSEGQAGTLLEAMSCGCVPIATRESGIDADQYGGWVVEGGATEHLYAVLQDVIKQHTPTEWQRRSQTVRAMIKARHSWGSFSASIRTIFQQYV